jgi:hypothetical protein
MRQYITQEQGVPCRMTQKHGVHDWVMPKGVFLDRDTLYRKSKGSNYFLRFRCNDPECTAEMDMLWSDVKEALNL